MTRFDISTIRKIVHPGLTAVVVPRDACEEIFVTGVPVNGEPPESVLKRATEFLRDLGARIVSQEIFGRVKNVDEVDWPVTYIEGDSKTVFAGTQVWAVKGVPIEPVRMDGRVVASLFRDGHTRYCRLGGITPSDNDLSRPEQTREVFERMEAILQSHQMGFDDVARTWFFNQDILGWYSEFNDVRTKFFREKGLTAGDLPASTGVGTRISSGTALVAGALAVQSTGADVRIETVASPLQNPAMDYDSSFSRAVEIVAPDHRRLLVSGTAGIDPAGDTAHVDDMDAQVELTLRVVSGILESRNMSWDHVTRAVVFVSNIEDAPAFARGGNALSLPPIPVVVTHNTLCRRDLLFEIELDAVQNIV